jgi:hypothetical protein
MRTNRKYILIGIALAIPLFVLPWVIRYENEHAEKVWVTFEVFYKDDTEIILYNQEDQRDSIVIRGSPKLFQGIQAVEILEYKIR